MYRLGCGNPMRSSRKALLLGIASVFTVGVCIAQFRPGGPGGGRFGGGGGRFGGGSESGPFIRSEGGAAVNEDTVKTARETVSHSTGTPNWTNSIGFKHDVFTFARAVFHSQAGSRGWRGSWMGWLNDYPDSDLNLSFRLQQMTTLKVDPDGRVVRLTSPELFSYPLIFMLKPGYIELTKDETRALRKYLLNGGALWLDDFWGSQEWENVEAQMKRVFPERTWEELPLEHPMFQGVFPLKVHKNELQVPSIQFYERTGQTSRNGEDSKDVHFRVWRDDQGRIMLIATHNTDNGDGWEREGENDEYFHNFCEKRAYPLAINIIFYLMTH
jgi:hypothetical protein